jgi:uncharacterized membrane protein YqjE
LDKSPSQATGPAESARALGASLLALLHVRVELAGIELREEAERRKQMLMLGLVAGLFLVLSLLLVALCVVVFFWDTHRLRAACGVTLVYGAIGTWAFLRVKSAARDSPAPFSATLEEFRKDLDLLRGHDE